MKPEDKELIMETLKASRFGLLLFTGFWIAGWLGAPVISLYIVASGLICYAHMKNKDHPKKLLIDFAWLTSIIILAVWLGALLGGKGLLGLGIIVLLFSLIIIWRRRDLWLQWVHHIEKRFLYGETLEEKRRK